MTLADLSHDQPSSKLTLANAAFDSDLITLDTASVAISLAEVYDPEVFTAASDAVREPASGTALRQVALELLAGSAYAPNITDDVLMGIIDRQHVEPERLPRVVENIHKARGIPVEVLRVIRDRWASNSNPATREAAVEIAALGAERDEAFWRKMMVDPSEDVRFLCARPLDDGSPRQIFAGHHAGGT